MASVKRQGPFLWPEQEGVIVAEQVKAKSQVSSRTRSIVFVALTIAIMAVSAWVSIPIGPISFTLQIFAIAFAVLVLSPVECIAAVAGYLLLGAIGVPVFSNMRGGVGVLAGASGGFLWGFLLGAGLAICARFLLQKFAGANASSKAAFAIDMATGIVFLLVSYVCGWAQLMAVASMSPAAAFAAGVAPFIVLDLIKLVAAVICANAVKRAIAR